MSAQRLDWQDDSEVTQPAFDKLGYPIPPKVAAAGQHGVASAAWQLLDASPLKPPYKRADFKKAVNTIIEQLTTEEASGVRATESRASSSTSELGRLEHDRTVEELPPGYTQDEYIAKLSEKSRELLMRAVGGSFEITEPIEGDLRVTAAAPRSLPSDPRTAMVEDATLAIKRNREYADAACKVAFHVGLDEATDEQRLAAFAEVESWTA